MGREGRTFRGGTSLPHYSIHLFYTILSFSFWFLMDIKAPYFLTLGGWAGFLANMLCGCVCTYG